MLRHQEIVLIGFSVTVPLASKPCLNTFGINYWDLFTAGTLALQLFLVLAQEGQVTDVIQDQAVKLVPVEATHRFREVLQRTHL